MNCLLGWACNKYRNKAGMETQESNTVFLDVPLSAMHTFARLQKYIIVYKQGCEARSMCTLIKMVPMTLGEKVSTNLL